ncbi:hypothetical protein D3C87_1203500 [compost metagenome]
MIRHQNVGRRSFRNFNAIIPWQAGHGKRIFHGGATPPGLAIDTLEREISANHQQAAALFDPCLEKLQTVWNGFRVQPNRRRQKQRIGTDVREDDRVIRIQPRHIEGKFLDSIMSRQVGQLVFTTFERLYQRFRAQVKGDAAELVEALVVSGGADPAFAHEKYFLYHFSFHFYGFVTSSPGRPSAGYPA